MKGKKLLLVLLVGLIAFPTWSASYFKYYNQGISFLKAKDYKNAELFFDRTLKNKPDFVPAMNALVQIYTIKKEYPKAITMCNKVIKAKPKETGIYLSLADVYRRLGRYKEARATLKKMYVFEPKNIDAKLVEADILSSLNNHNEAINVYNDIAKINKEKAFESYRRIGIIYLNKKNDLINAEVYCKKALSIKPHDERTLKLLGYTYLKKKAWAKAAQQLSKVSEKALSTEDLNWLGYCYRTTKNIDKAIHYYEKLFRRSKNKDQKSAVALSELYKKKGNNVKSSEYSKIATSSDIVDYSAAYKLGYNLLKSKKYSEAIIQFKKSIKSKNDFYGSWYALGICEYNLGKKTIALRNFKKASELKPSYPTTWWYMAMIYDSQKKLKDAVAAYSQAIGYDPKNPGLWYNLGVDYFELKDYNNAAAAFEQAIKLKPNYIDALYNLSNAYQKLGKPNLAADALRKAQKLEGK